MIEDRSAPSPAAAGTTLTAADVGWNASLAAGETKEPFGAVVSGCAFAVAEFTINMRHSTPRPADHTTVIAVQDRTPGIAVPSGWRGCQGNDGDTAWNNDAASGPERVI